MNRKKIAIGMVLGLVGLVGLFVAVRTAIYWHEQRATALQALEEIKVDYILTPASAEPLPQPLGAGFDVTDAGDIVIRGGDSLLQLEPQENETLVAGKLTDTAPDDFALDQGGTVLTVKGQYFGQLEADAPSKALPLPATGMRLAPSYYAGIVYLFAGPGVSARRVYGIFDDGTYNVLAEIPEPVVDVTDSSGAFYVASDHTVYRFTLQSDPQVVIRLDASEDAIQSIAMMPDDRTLFYSTADTVYAMKGLAAIAIVHGVGGVLHYRNGYLYLWNADRQLLVRLDVASLAATGET